MPDREYCKFNLDQKELIELSYYNKHVALRREGKILEVIECPNQNFKLDPNDVVLYNNNGCSLNCLGQNLEEIERFNESIKLNPIKPQTYYLKLNKKVFIQKKI